MKTPFFYLALCGYMTLNGCSDYFVPFQVGSRELDSGSSKMDDMPKSADMACPSPGDMAPPLPSVMVINENFADMTWMSRIIITPSDKANCLIQSVSMATGITLNPDGALIQDGMTPPTVVVTDYLNLSLMPGTQSCEFLIEPTDRLAIDMYNSSFLKLDYAGGQNCSLSIKTISKRFPYFYRQKLTTNDTSGRRVVSSINEAQSMPGLFITLTNTGIGCPPLHISNVKLMAVKSVPGTW